MDPEVVVKWCSYSLRNWRIARSQRAISEFCKGLDKYSSSRSLVGKHLYRKWSPVLTTRVYYLLVDIIDQSLLTTSITSPQATSLRSVACTTYVAGIMTERVIVLLINRRYTLNR